MQAVFSRIRDQKGLDGHPLPNLSDMGSGRGGVKGSPGDFPWHPTGLRAVVQNPSTACSRFIHRAAHRRPRLPPRSVPRGQQDAGFGRHQVEGLVEGLLGHPVQLLRGKGQSRRQHRAAGAESF